MEADGVLREVPLQGAADARPRLGSAGAKIDWKIFQEEVRDTRWHVWPIFERHLLTCVAFFKGHVLTCVAFFKGHVLTCVALLLFLIWYTHLPSLLLLSVFLTSLPLASVRPTRGFTSCGNCFTCAQCMYWNLLSQTSASIEYKPNYENQLCLCVS